MYYTRYQLSFRQVEDILHERGVDICHETVRFWVERFGVKLHDFLGKEVYLICSYKFIQAGIV